MINRLIVILSLLFIPFGIYAQRAGDLDLTYNPDVLGYWIGDGADDVINTSLLQPDGKILIGGEFSNYNAINRNKIARLNPDGSLDASFSLKVAFTGSSINALAVQADRKIIIGGFFSKFGNDTKNNIARLNTDGSLDLSFNISTGPNSIVHAIIIQPDGKILIGGRFTAYDGTSSHGIARLQDDGTLDTSFNPGIGVDLYVLSMSLQPDGKTVIAGNFTSFNGVQANRIARLNPDGSMDTSFITGSGFNNYVNSMVLLPNGKLLATGKFSNYNGSNYGKVIRLNANGTPDAGFIAGNAANALVSNVTLQPDGKIVLTGNFSAFNGLNHDKVVRLNTNGTIDAGFLPGLIASGNFMNCLVQPDGKLLLSGYFVGFNNDPKRCITRLNSDGSFDSGFNPGTVNTLSVRTTELQQSGKLLVGGAFAKYNGSNASHIARLNHDGTIDGSFNPSSWPVDHLYPTQAMVNTILEQPNGRIIVGGHFTSFGTFQNHIARILADGSLDPSFNTGTGFSGNSTWSVKVLALALQPDGKILVGGEFTHYNNNMTNNILRLNSNGSLDVTFNSGYGASQTVRTIAIDSNGKIIIGGDFNKYNGNFISRIARLNPDGSLDQSFQGAATFSQTNTFPYLAMVNKVYIQPNGKILVGGNFDHFNNTAKVNLVRLNANGTLDPGFSSGSGPATMVHSISLEPNGKIIIGGDFTTYNGALRNRLARLNANGTLDNSFNPLYGADLPIYATALQPDGNLIIGGNFRNYNGTDRNHIARVLGTSVTTRITTGALNAPGFCRGSTINVPFSVSTPFNQGNIFKAQLSAVGGSFATPTIIGTVTGSGSGSINATLPVTLVPGSGYRIRVVASSPASIGSYTPSGVVIASDPMLTVYANNPSICLGGSAILTVSGAQSYNWAAGNGLTAQNGNQVTVTPTSTGTFTYSVNGNNYGCTNTGSFTLTVTNPLPLVISASQQVLCVGESVTLTATGAITYHWNTGKIGPLLTVSPLVTTTYTVTGNSNGCSNTTSFTVVVKPRPAVTVTAGSQAICAGHSITLTAHGATSYLWSNGQTGNSITVSPVTTTAYSVVGTKNGCSASASLSVLALPPLAPPVITGNSPVCSNTSLQLQAVSVPGATYLWTGPGGFSSTLPNPVIPQASANSAGLYTVAVTDANGCTAQANYQVKVTSPDSSFSYAGIGQLYSFTANGTGNYMWTFPGGTPDSSTAQNVLVTFNTPGNSTMTLTTTTGNNCTATSTQTISILGAEPVLKSETLSIYPNPTNEFLTLQFPVSISGSYDLKLYNSIGERLTNYTIDVKENKLIADLHFFPAGMYKLYLQITGGVYIETIVKY